MSRVGEMGITVKSCELLRTIINEKFDHVLFKRKTLQNAMEYIMGSLKVRTENKRHTLICFSNLKPAWN